MKSAQLTNAAFLFATTGVLFSVACSEAGPTSPDPRSASGAVPHFAVQEPTRTSANASLVEVEWVKVCVTYPDRVGPAAKVEVVVDIPQSYLAVNEITPLVAVNDLGSAVIPSDHSAKVQLP